MANKKNKKSKAKKAQAEAASKKGLIIALVVLVVVIAIAAVAYGILAPQAAPEQMQVQGGSSAAAGNTSAQSSGATGSSASAAADSDPSPAPDFSMETMDGEQVTLSGLEGKPIILNFWASTCGPCKMEMPEFQKAYEQYGDEVQFVMVNIPDFNGETRERALQLVEQSGYTFPVYFDSAAQAQLQYGIRSIPQTYFITADGNVEAYANGAIDAATLERGIAMLL